MSWGERSCKHYGACPIPLECTYETCNHRCRMYENNGKLTETELLGNPTIVRPREVCRAVSQFGTCTGTKGHTGPHHVGRKTWKGQR